MGEMMKKIIFFCFILLLLIFIIGCAKQETPAETSMPAEEARAEEQKQQIANPASVYCQEQGGILEIRNLEEGQVGYCIKEGKECEEWAFYRGECSFAEKTVPETTVPMAISTNPVDILSDEFVSKQGADCRDKKTDLEKANCLLDWQEANIHWCYTHPEETVMPRMFESGYPDCVADMQFQQMAAGSFPVSKAMELKTRKGKIFGACYTYATIYCAFARWNGLKCRVMEVKIITPRTYSASSGDYGPGYCGAAQKSYLDALGLDCDEWKKKDWTIDYDHYWAEVLIEGKWKIMEKPTWAYMRDTQKNIIDAGRDYKDTGW